MRLRLALAAATCIALPLAAHAQPVTGPYVAFGLGTAIENPTNFHVSDNVPNSTSGKLLWKPDYAGVASVGYGFGDGFRVELGGDYIRNTASKFDAVLNSDPSVTGQIRAFGAEEKYGPMVNALYDFSVGLPVFPYVGAGVGYQWAKFDHRISDGHGDSISGARGSFAYQFIVGLAYPLPWVPGLSLTAEYRFMQLTSSRNYEYDCGCGSVKVGPESDHIFLLGLRYQIFNPPPPPPPAVVPVAAPAPVPAKTYLVFFDWDKYNLTPRALNIISQAASDSKTTNSTTIDVSGYTDTSGSPGYNQVLSLRRAKAVAAQLVADGVPASEIEIHAYGETHLLVQTGPGVREPQNRRVEIVLQ